MVLIEIRLFNPFTWCLLDQQDRRGLLRGILFGRSMSSLSGVVSLERPRQSIFGSFRISEFQGLLKKVSWRKGLPKKQFTFDLALSFADHASDPRNPFSIETN